MRTYLTAVALAAALAQPASAITFSALTTIHVGTGVQDSGTGPNTAIATVFQCSNVSGRAAVLRFLVLEKDSTFIGSDTVNVPHGGSTRVGTRPTTVFVEDEAIVSPGTPIIRGTINIESTESGVFCTAMIVDAAAATPIGIDLHLVRVNPHPGTVE